MGVTDKMPQYAHNFNLIKIYEKFAERRYIFRVLHSKNVFSALAQRPTIVTFQEDKFEGYVVTLS